MLGNEKDGVPAVGTHTPVVCGASFPRERFLSAIRRGQRTRRIRPLLQSAASLLRAHRKIVWTCSVPAVFGVKVPVFDLPFGFSLFLASSRIFVAHCTPRHLLLCPFSLFRLPSHCVCVCVFLILSPTFAGFTVASRSWQGCKEAFGTILPVQWLSNVFLFLHN